MINDKDSIFSPVMTAESYQNLLNSSIPLKTDDKYLDKLLDGGLRKGLVHLLIGSRKKTSKILMKAAVKAFMSPSEGGIGASKIAYVDGDNRFSPYYISQLALSMKMNPSLILSNIYIARAFNWSQMVEITETKLSQFHGLSAIFISGLTSMFELSDDKENVSGRSKLNPVNMKAFNDLQAAIQGIKKSVENNEPIVVVTVPRHKNSLYKPIGGNILTHFGCVIVQILEQERATHYLLHQHPFLPFRNETKWKSITEEIIEKYNKWNNMEKETTKKIGEQGEKWKKTINQPSSRGYVKEIRNLKLKNKRTRTNKKRISDTTQNLTLDFYLKQGRKGTNKK